MTKKMFQISRIIAILATVFIGVGLLSDEKVYLLDGDMKMRCVWQSVCLVYFLLVSHLYEKKIKIFSVGYLFIFINVFIIGTLGPFFFTNSRLLADAVGGARMPKDHYDLYMVIYFSVMTIILVYLLLQKHTTEEIKREDFLNVQSKDDTAVLLSSVLLVLPAMLVLGETGLLFGVPILCYFFLRIMDSKFTFQMNVICYIGLLIGMYGLYRVRYNRYLVVEYIVPIAFAFCTYVAVNDSKKKGKIVVPLLFAGIFAVLAYGIVSEMVKLNMYWGRSYNIWDELTDFTSVIDFVERQVFRLFGVWTELGGNIIEHVQINGFYHGLTYIKSLAPYFGFEYVNLPQISAKYIVATYAQPGIIAEGYANFGIIGSIGNVLVPFFMIEFLLRYFLKKRDAFSICLMSCCFVKLMIDGGTINNIIFAMAVCVLVFSAYLFFRWIGTYVVGLEKLKLHIVEKKKYVCEEDYGEDIDHCTGI